MPQNPEIICIGTLLEHAKRLYRAADASRFANQHAELFAQAENKLGEALSKAAALPLGDGHIAYSEAKQVVFRIDAVKKLLEHVADRLDELERSLDELIAPDDLTRAMDELLKYRESNRATIPVVGEVEATTAHGVPEPYDLPGRSAPTTPPTAQTILSKHYHLICPNCGADDMLPPFSKGSPLHLHLLKGTTVFCSSCDSSWQIKLLPDDGKVRPT